MPSKHDMDITILAIFRPGDPVRQILREYAAGARGVLCCYDHLFDALSRMPIMDNPHTAVIVARPETLTADAAGVFEPLVNANATHYVLWMDGTDSSLWQWPLRPANLHTARTMVEFCDILSRIQPVPVPPSCSKTAAPTGRRPLKLNTAPLSEAELEALLGASL